MLSLTNPGTYVAAEASTALPAVLFFTGAFLLAIALLVGRRWERARMIVGVTGLAILVLGFFSTVAWVVSGHVDNLRAQSAHAAAVGEWLHSDYRIDVTHDQVLTLVVGDELVVELQPGNPQVISLVGDRGGLLHLTAGGQVIQPSS